MSYKVQSTPSCTIDRQEGLKLNLANLAFLNPIKCSQWYTWQLNRAACCDSIAMEANNAEEEYHSRYRCQTFKKVQQVDIQFGHQSTSTAYVVAIGALPHHSDRENLTEPKTTLVPETFCGCGTWVMFLIIAKPKSRKSDVYNWIGPPGCRLRQPKLLQSQLPKVMLQLSTHLNLRNQIEIYSRLGKRLLWSRITHKHLW